MRVRAAAELSGTPFPEVHVTTADDSRSASGWSPLADTPYSWAWHAREANEEIEAWSRARRRRLAAGTGTETGSAGAESADAMEPASEPELRADAAAE